MFDMELPWWEFVLRASIVYVALLVMMRFSGKRTVGQFTPFDLLVVMLLSEAVSSSLSGGDDSIPGALILALTLIVLNVAIAVATDAQWIALRDALGAPDWAAAGALTTRAGRVAQHDLIDGHLAAWCATRAGDEIVESLWPAGVPVAKVMQPHRQTELPQLRHRRFFEFVGHPVNPAAPHSTLPIALSRGPAELHRTAAPLLGEHNDELLTQLGLSPEEIRALREDGVIGSEPGARRTAAR